MTKPYKCRVEYLTSDGNQYIDMGVGVKANTVFKAIFSVASTSTGRSYFGARNSSNERFQIVNSIGIGGGYYLVNTVYPIADKKYEIEMRASGEMYLDGVKRNASTGTFSQVSFERNLWLFATNYYDSSVGGGASTFWKAQVFEGDTLVRDLIPVLDNNGRPAMYDNVSGQLFYNLGSGEFTYGRKIIPVEYLESTGTQYIDTGFKGKNNLHYKLKVNFTALSTGSSNGIGGEYLGNASAYIGMVRANGHFTYLFNNTAVETTTTFYANTDYVIDSTMNNGSQVVKVNDETISTGTISGTFTSTRNIFLYAICSTNDAADVYGSLKIYYLQIYDNGTIVRDFIPAIDENNTPFMFDLVNCKVYENAGTGQFKVGANVEKSGKKNFLRKKLDLILATLRKKRPYYCELEYLESTGTQYINTGLLSTANSKVDCVFGFTSMESGAANNVGVFGGRNATTTNTFTLFKIASATPQYFRFDYNGQPSAATANQMAWNTTSKYRLEYMGAQIIATNLTTGESVTTTRTPGSTFTSYPIYLFAVNTSGTTGQYLSGRIYRYWYSDGTNTIDLIPVLDWNMTPCMYDKISGKLFYNQGTGDFQYGREIHYVEYLETTSQVSTSTTKPWINTLVNYWADFEIGVKLRESASNVCLSCGGGSYRLERINATNPYWRFQGGGGSYNYDSTIPITEYHVLKWKDGKISCDGEVLVERDHLLNSGTYTALFTNSTSSGNTIYPNVVYFLKMWNPSDGTLVRDYLPAIDSNGVAFMFDRVTHTIFDNAGTGTFKYPAREVEYLESDGARAIVAGVTVDDTCGYDVKWMALNANDTIILGTKGAGDSRWVLSGSNNPNVNISWNTSSGGAGLGLNKIQTAQMNYLNDRKRILNDIPLADISATLSANASTYNVGIFGGYWDSSTISLYSTCRIYYAKITKGIELIRDFIPMIKDGLPCLFDKVGGLYYFGVGTGTFSTGKIVEPEYES